MTRNRIRCQPHASFDTQCSPDTSINHSYSATQIEFASAVAARCDRPRPLHNQIDYAATTAVPPHAPHTLLQTIQTVTDHHLHLQNTMHPSPRSHTSLAPLTMAVSFQLIECILEDKSNNIVNTNARHEDSIISKAIVRRMQTCQEEEQGVYHL